MIDRNSSYPFPETAYVPGRTARPTEEPLASYGIEPQPLSVTIPRSNPHFLYGVDLFNGGFFWEAHEAWELIWHLEPDPAVKACLKGLIQAAGGYLKIVQGNEHGARLLFHRSLTYLSLPLLEELKISFRGYFAMIEEDDGIETLSVERNFVPILLI